MEIMVLSFFAFLLSFFLLSKFKQSDSKNLPPSPPSLPIIGHLHLFKKPLYKTLLNLSHQYGPILYLRFGSRPVLVVSSPSAAEECFTTNDIIFANRPRLLIGKHLGNDYKTISWAPYGDHWRNLRRITTLKIFSTNSLRMFSDIRTDEVRSMITQLVKGYQHRTIEMKKVFFELTANIMMRMMTGKRYYGDEVEEGSDEAKRFQELIKETFSISGSSMEDFLPVLRWVGHKRNEKELLRLKKKRDGFFQELIEQHRKVRNSSSNDYNGESKKKNLMDVLLSFQETEPDSYPDEMIRGIIAVILSAGTDTSAGTMEWAMSLLLNHPDIIKKAQAEIDATTEGRLLAESDINNLPYLHCIINETFRMYPSGALIAPHESSKDCVVGGFNIPRGTMLFVNLWAIQNDPSIWDDPKKFRPERFGGIKGARDGFKLMPFGSGRRGCPGEGLAMHVIGLALGTLIQCFDWERVGEEMVDMREGSGLNLSKAQPLEVKCKPRRILLDFLS